MKSGQALGKVLEFAGAAVEALDIDERATLTNMAVEAGGFTGIIEADDVDGRLPRAAARPGSRARPSGSATGSHADPDAEYAETFEIDASDDRADGGDAGRSAQRRPARTSSTERVKIDIAYGGSCTGGKKADMDMYARVLRDALEQGRARPRGRHLLHPVRLAGHPALRREQGYLESSSKAGAELVDPSCGACIKAGPGVSSEQGPGRHLSAINRNFPGRSGPGQVYLASPLIVAASAIAGYIAPYSAPVPHAPVGA